MRSNAIIMFMKKLERRKRTLDSEANCNEIQRYHYVYEEVREKKEDLGRQHNTAINFLLTHFVHLNRPVIVQGKNVKKNFNIG